jgi:hypothetical protein
LIDSTFVEAIRDGVATQEFTVGDRTFFSEPVHNPPFPEEPKAATLEIETLSGIGDYLKSDSFAKDRKDASAGDCLLHVVSHKQVDLFSPIMGVHRFREKYLTSVRGGNIFKFGEFYPHTNFIIALQSLFLDFGDRAKVLKAIKDNATRTSNDDGVTQRVTATVGIALADEVSLPNPVLLKPYRTFAEVEQPPSEFVLRVQASRQGTLPEAALFEADGGRWAREAIISIREYLKQNTAGIPIIA